MAMNIPLPSADFGGGLAKTSQNLLQQLMQKGLEDAKREQAERHFQEQLKLSKAAAGRAASNADLHRQLLEQQILAAQHANDPMYEFNQFKNLMGLMGGQGGGQMPQEPMPTQEFGEGMGMFPEGQVPQPIQANTMPQTGGFNFDALKQNPILRGYFKKKFGFDPLAPSAQTQEEKDAAALNLFKQKEAIKNQSKSGEMATNKVLTQNQQAIQAIDTVLPMIDEFIKNPKLVYGATDFSQSKKAAYNAKTGGMIDMLVAAQSLPQVKESVSLVEQQIRRGTGESVDSYIKRLKDFKKDLIARRGKAQGVVKSKQVNTADLPVETKVINGVTYYSDGQGGWEHD